jgi:hypothetical protein
VSAVELRKSTAVNLHVDSFSGDRASTPPMSAARDEIEREGPFKVKRTREFV